MTVGVCGALCTACTTTHSPTVAEGRELYSGNGCTSCHGPDGHGDGPIGQTLSPPPRDFRSALAFKKGTTARAIANTILIGIDDGTKMPPFAHLTESERMSLALYVISVRDSTHSTHPKP